MAKYEVIGDVYVGKAHHVGSPDGENNPTVDLEPAAAANAVKAGNLRPADAEGKKAAKKLDMPDMPEPVKEEPKGKK